jgi:hypothetical protein
VPCKTDPVPNTVKPANGRNDSSQNRNESFGRESTWKQEKRSQFEMEDCHPDAGVWLRRDNTRDDQFERGGLADEAAASGFRGGEGEWKRSLDEDEDTYKKEREELRRLKDEVRKQADELERLRSQVEVYEKQRNISERVPVPSHMMRLMKEFVSGYHGAGSCKVELLEQEGQVLFVGREDEVSDAKERFFIHIEKVGGVCCRG